MSRPIIPYEALTSGEAYFLHPAHWDGNTAGVANGRARAFKPYHNKRGEGALIAASIGMLKAIGRAQHHEAYLPQHFPKGSEVDLQEHIAKKGIVVCDRSTLVTRGEYSVDPSQFPDPASLPNPQNFPFPEQPSTPYYKHLEPNLLYLREASPVIIDHKGQAALGTSIESSRGPFRGWAEHHYQLGALAVPAQMTVGEVTHDVMSDGTQIIARTHNVFVYPDPGQVLTPKR